MYSPNQVDVVIIGGGLAGLTLALQLRQAIPDIQVAVLERNQHPVNAAAHKVGESTVEIGAHYLSEIIGERDHLQKQHLSKFGLRFFFRDDRQSPLSSGLEIGGSNFFPVPTYQIDRGILENHLGKKAQQNDIHFIDACIVRKIELDKQSDHTIHYDKNSQRHQVRARWLVDASGRAGLLKQKLGIKQSNSHDVNAIWFRIADKIDINDWCSDPYPQQSDTEANHRWLSTNHLMGHGYWVWLIPLASGSTSIGIVADPNHHPLEQFSDFDKALAWLQHHEPQCAAAISKRKHLLQDFLKLKHYSHSCSQVFSTNRWALTGDAGVFLDPFYSSGSDFIAISNTYITELIRRELNGEPITVTCAVFQKLYFSFFENSLLLYQNQYPIFGHAKIISVKLIWDYAMYWGVNAFLFFNNKFADIATITQLQKEFAQMRRLNEAMQPLFREWAQQETEPLGQQRLHHDKIQPLFQLNQQLTQAYSNEDFIQQFRDNIALLQSLSTEIIQQANKHLSNLKKHQLNELIPQQHLATTFTQLKL